MFNSLYLTNANVEKGSSPHIIFVTVPKENPKYTAVITKTTPVRNYKGHFFFYCPITVKPAITDLFIFKWSAAEKEECELIPRLVVSMKSLSDTGNMQYLLQRLADFLNYYIVEKQRLLRVSHDVHVRSADLLALFNASISGAVNTIYSLAEGVRQTIRPYVSLRNDCYTLSEVTEETTAYLSSYKDALDNHIPKEATLSGAFFTREFIEKYIEEYKNYLLLSISYDKARDSVA